MQALVNNPLHQFFIKLLFQQKHDIFPLDVPQAAPEVQE